MNDAVIVAAARTPIGRATHGSLADQRPDDLAELAVAEALTRVPQLDPARIDDIYLGCAMPGGEQGFNLARMVAIGLGLDSVPGATVARYCSSSLQTTRMAMHAIRAGEAHVVISAGVECVSRYTNGVSDTLPNTKNPRYADAEARSARSLGSATPWVDPRDQHLVPDPYIAMGLTAENVARLRGVTRQEQDEFAVRSQNLAEEAMAKGFWEREITPVTLADGSTVSRDDGIRPNVTYESVSQLKPAFHESGTVTAANCCPLNDGAAALVVMSDVMAARLGITPLARIVATGVSALSPEIMGLGPVEASQRALSIAGMTIDDIDLVEINEAFAAQVIPAYRDLGIDLDRLNVNGGAIAIGHPYGMTGARLTCTLINSFEAHDKEFGLETMCVAGGQGMAMILQRMS